jgi:uncharacterized protein YjbI with pentapeptide repeats
VQKLTVREAAENLGISEDAVRKRIQRGTLAHSRSSDGHVYVYMGADNTAEIASEEDADTENAHGKQNEDRSGEREKLRRIAWPRWTGFRNKTVWDWLHLLSALAIPIVLAGAGFWFTSQQARHQQDIEERRAKAEQLLEEQRAQDTALQAYLDQMSQLLLDQNLLNSEEDDSARALAQARTTTIIARLDARGNRSVTRFLTDSGLTGASPANLKRSSSVSLLSQAELRDANLAGAFLPSANLTKAELQDADLSNASLVSADLSGANLEGADLEEAHLLFANLSEANLKGANLRGVALTEVSLEGANLKEAILPSSNFNLADILQPGISLEGANLVGADLKGRDLADADLSGADLSDASLADANLKRADLSSTDLSEADLKGANLAQADLTEADVSPEELAQAESLQGAMMPNGQKYEDWLKSKGRKEDGNSGGSS